MKDKVIIYGGAFNPPTVAHEAIARVAAGYAYDNDADFWVLLSGERTDKSICAPIEKRVQYGAALLASINTTVDTRVCTYELERPLTQTAHTVEHLVKEHPETEFTWLFGSDSIQTMPKWSGGEWLIKNLQMLVVQRVGYEVELAENMTELEAETPIVSSTQVRQRLQRGESVTGLVPEKVISLL